MKFYKRILFPTDFSECADEAYEYALLMANKYNAELHVFYVNVVYSNAFGPEFEITTNVPYDHKQHMEKYKSNYGFDVDKIKKVSIKGYATAPCIVDYIKKESMDLVIMGTHGRRGIRHMLLGSVTEEVLKQLLAILSQLGKMIQLNQCQNIFLFRRTIQNTLCMQSLKDIILPINLVQI